MTEHTYTDQMICLDCCIPAFLAIEHDEHACPYVSVEVAEYITAWWPLYEASMEHLREVTDEVLAELTAAYFDEAPGIGDS